MKRFGLILFMILVFVLSSWQNNKKLHHTKIKRDEINAFTYGEKLKYKISIGFIDAGFAELEVKKYEKNNNYFHVIGTGYTNSTVDYFFKIRDRYESIIDSSSLCPIEFIRSVEEGNASFKQNYIFNQTEKTVFDGKSEISTCENIQDMVSCYFFARNLNLKNLKKGEILTFPTFVDGEKAGEVVYNGGKNTASTNFFIGRSWSKRDLNGMSGYIAWSAYWKKRLSQSDAAHIFHNSASFFSR